MHRRKMSIELGAGGGGVYRDKDLLIMTVMIEMLKTAVSQSNEQCECWDGM